jgi:predicted amidophosphoribosyltransferase
MNNGQKICLYCQTPNDNTAQQCKNCGMPLAKKSHKSKKIKLFVKAFWLIVIFSAVMIYYLPR